ncbi:MAG: GNAT family N-acetyltransferase [Phycisphaerae bacterium]|nr:GNAT family N-acetyltransferase [Phycisphaerae bacterium]
MTPIATCGTHLGPSIQAQIEKAFRAAIHGPAVVSEDAFVRLMTGEAHPFANFAMVRDPSDLKGSTIAVEPLCACGAPAAVIYSSSVSAPVEQYLRDSGFQAHDPMPAMAVEIERLPACTLAAGCEFVRIDPQSEGDEWGGVFAAGYELPAGVGVAFSPKGLRVTAEIDAPLQYFAVRKNGRMIGTTLLFLEGGLAGIYAVATLPAERRQGLGAYMTAQALRVAHSLGYRVGVLQASEDGHPVYKRLGFIDVGAVPLYVRVPE